MGNRSAMRSAGKRGKSPRKPPPKAKVDKKLSAMSKQYESPRGEVIDICLSPSRRQSFEKQSKKIASKVRKAARLAKRYGHAGTADYLRAIARTLEEPTLGFCDEITGFDPVGKATKR